MRAPGAAVGWTQPSARSHWRPPPCQRNSGVVRILSWRRTCAWQGLGALVRRAVSVEGIGQVMYSSGPTRTMRNSPASRTSFVDATDSALLTVARRVTSGERRPPGHGHVVHQSNRSQARLHRRRSSRFRSRGRAGRSDGGGRRSDRRVQGRRGGRRSAGPRCARRSPAIGSTRCRRSPRSGHKVIACAWQPLDRAWTGAEPAASDFRLAGVLAFEIRCETELRPRSPPAVQLFTSICSSRQAIVGAMSRCPRD